MFVRFYCASIFLSKHTIDMFNEFLFSLGDFGKIGVPHPYTTASLIFLVHWQIFPNFARRSRIRESSNFDHIFGKTNRIRPSATPPPPPRILNDALIPKISSELQFPMEI